MCSWHVHDRVLLAACCKPLFFQHFWGRTWCVLGTDTTRATLRLAGRQREAVIKGLFNQTSPASPASPASPTRASFVDTHIIILNRERKGTRDHNTSLLGSRGGWDHAYSETGSGEFAHELTALQRLESRPSELRVLLRRQSAVQGKKESAGGE